MEIAVIGSVIQVWLHTYNYMYIYIYMHYL